MAVDINSERVQKQDGSQSDTLGLLSSTQSIIKKAVRKLGYNEEMYELLKEPLRILTVRIPVRMDDGSFVGNGTEIFEA